MTTSPMKAALEASPVKIPQYCLSTAKESTKKRGKNLLVKVCTKKLSPVFEQSKYKAISVAMLEKESNIVHNIVLEKEIEKASRAAAIDSVLAMKDANKISDAAYSAISKQAKSMPRKHHLIKRRRELNAMFNPTISPDGNSAKITVKELLEKKFEDTRLHKILDGKDVIRIKLGGDGKRLPLFSKRLHFFKSDSDFIIGTRVAKLRYHVNFLLTLLDDFENTQSSFHTHPVLIYEGGEDYDLIKAQASDLVNEIKDLEENGIRLLGQTFRVSVCYGGDLKFLLTVLGLDSASCNHSCPFCVVHKSERHKVRQSFPLRKLSEIAMKAKENPRSQTKYNCSNEPLFPFAPDDEVIHKYVPDILHYFLRAGERIVLLFVNELLLIDQKKAPGIKLDPKDSTLIQMLQRTMAAIGDNIGRKIELKIGFGKNKDVSFNSKYTF